MKLAEITTIPKLARASGVPHRTLFRKLLAMHAQHGGDWLFRFNKSIRINLPALRAAHPAMFEPADLSSRVEELAEDLGDNRHETEANTSAIGQLSRRMAKVEEQLVSLKAG